MEIKYPLAGVALLAFSITVIGLVQANHFSICSPGCNSTVVWWNDTVNVTGVGSALASVTARLNGVTACTTTTSASGNWNCSFPAPYEVGRYNLSVAVGTAADDSVLAVKPSYGVQPASGTSRFVLEVPETVQEPSGRINNLIARLFVYRGPPT